MKFDTYLKEDNKLILNEKSFFHNNLSIDEWYSSKDVDLAQKILMESIFLYSSDKNKDKKPEERVYFHNSYFMDKYKLTRSGVQKAFRCLEKMGVIVREFKTATGEYLTSKEAQGLTNRRIILDANKAKDLLSTTYDEAAASGYIARSRERRFLKRRPITLVRNVINSIIKTQVSDVNARKAKLKDAYLKMQYKAFGQFTINIEYDMEQTDKALLSNLKSLIFDPPKTLLDANWTDSN